MRLIKSSFEIWEQSPGEIGIYKQIERAGRVCYKSEDRLTEDSYIRFVEMLKSHAHGAMLEHGAVYLKIPIKEMEINHVIFNNKYSKITNDDNYLYISTNYRVLVENNCEDLLKYICEPTKSHERRVTVHFITDRGVSHEYVRHRVFSFAQESTRYCNYSKNKFNNELAFIIPSWIEMEEGRITTDSFGCPTIVNEETYDFLSGLGASERSYFRLINREWTPQQARQVLPNALKTELIMTGFISDWGHFFELRCDQSAHPDARALAIPLRDEFIKREFIE